ncbi:MAG TPA: HDOD domain-containing protein [Gallionellaceae bacterium]|nr:HDOD domain-containing protein [Gallionellaceae bacterium]
MTELSAELSKKLSDAVDKMPAFPKSVQRILELSRDMNCPPKELVGVIEKDPVMTIKLLRMLNSAYYNFPKQITSVNQSVIYLGLNTIKNMALSFAVVGVLPEKNAAGFDMQRYLMHSLTTATLARVLCQKFADDGTDPGDCYIAGLLHDFGKVMFAQHMPEEFKVAMDLSAENGIPLHEAEQKVIGVDHAVAGAMLVEKWQFQKSLSDTIRHLHDGQLTNSAMQNCLYVADQISKHQVSGRTDNIETILLPDNIMGRFGGDLNDILVQLGDLSKVLDEARVFSQAHQEANK